MKNLIWETQEDNPGAAGELGSVPVARNSALPRPQDRVCAVQAQFGSPLQPAIHYRASRWIDANGPGPATLAVIPTEQTPLKSAGHVLR